MALEIERKYLVTGDGWRSGARPTVIRQGYLFSSETLVVRVRTCGERGYLTIKGGGAGLARPEYEYEIPLADATELLDTLCRRPLIEKTRHAVDVDGVEWVVDVFAGENDGLIVAELELESEDQAVDIPPWVGREVSGDARYLNANLGERPFKSWSADVRAPRR